MDFMKVDRKSVEIMKDLASAPVQGYLPVLTCIIKKFEHEVLV